MYFAFHPCHDSHWANAANSLHSTTAKQGGQSTGGLLRITPASHAGCANHATSLAQMHISTDSVQQRRVVTPPLVGCSRNRS